MKNEQLSEKRTASARKQSDDKIHSNLILALNTCRGEERREKKTYKSSSDNDGERVNNRDKLYYICSCFAYVCAAAAAMSERGEREKNRVK